MKQGIEELENIFRRDPANTEAFDALQKLYEHEGRLDSLATLLEQSARHLDDLSQTGQRLWSAAQIYLQCGDERSEHRVLNTILSLNLSHRPALDRLKQLAQKGENWTELLRLLGIEAKALAENGEDSRVLAHIEYSTGAIWERYFGRFDQAIAYYQKAFHTNPQCLEAITAARQLFGKLGQWKPMMALYDIELSHCSDIRRKAEMLIEMGNLQWNRLGDLEAAAHSFNAASQMCPDDESILLTLSELYAASEWPLPRGLEKATSVLLQLAEQRQAKQNVEGKIVCLKRALEINPESNTVRTKLEQSFLDSDRWEELQNLYLNWINHVTEQEQIIIHFKRGEILFCQLNSFKVARECYEAVIAKDPSHEMASVRLLEIYRAERNWERAAQLLRRQVEKVSVLGARVSLLMELALIERDQLGHMEEAAKLFHQVLQIVPDHREALKAYSDYFRQKKDYRNLVELLRFIVQSTPQIEVMPEEVNGWLEEIATISEDQLGDLESAIQTWQQLAQLPPNLARAQEEIQRLEIKARKWHSMVNVLEWELEGALAPAQRLQTLLRMVQFYYENRVNAKRTIELLLELISLAPNDGASLRLLADLYEREHDWPGLVFALEGQLATDLAPTERVSILRRLYENYLKKLDKPKNALTVLHAILEVAPHDSKALDAIQDILEKSDDLEQQVHILEHRVRTSRSLSDQLNTLRSLAHLMDDRLENPSQAAEYWERILKLEPEDQEALEALTRLYNRMGRHESMLMVLHHRLQLVSNSDNNEKVKIWRQIASLAEEQLENHEEAAKAYEHLAQLQPNDIDIYEALARVYPRLERYADLARVLGRLIELSKDSEQIVVLALKQADLLEDKLADTEGAILIFEHIISEYSPGDLDAHRRLKELYLRQGKYQRACEIAERELFLLPEDAEDRLSLSLEIARLWNEKAQNKERAVLCYERVLSLDPGNLNALNSLRTLYPQINAYTNLLGLGPSLLATITNREDRFALMMELAETCDSKLGDPTLAFQWFRRAHALCPGEGEPLAQLQRLAQTHGLWEELISIYLDDRKQIKNPEQFFDLTEEVAYLCQHELQDSLRAFHLLQQALSIYELREKVVTSLEQLAEEIKQPQYMSEVYTSLLTETNNKEEQKIWLLRRARWAENKIKDSNTAFNDLIRVFYFDTSAAASLIPDIDRLAMETKRWDEAIAIHKHRLREATQNSEKLAIIQHLANIQETEAGDLVGAFHGHLQAFSLFPLQLEISNNLWRLATLISESISPTAPILPSSQPSRPDEDSIISVFDAELELVEEGDEPLDATEMVDVEGTDPHIIDRAYHDPTHPDTAVTHKPPPLPIPSVGSPLLPLSTSSHDLSHDMESKTISPWDEWAQAYLALPTSSPSERIQQLLAVAKIWAEGEKDIENAFNTLAEAAAMDIEHPELQRTMTDWAARYDRPDRILGIYLDALKNAATTEKLVWLHSKIVDIFVAQDNQEAAAYHLNALLVLQPENHAVASQLRQIYRTDGRWEELVHLRENQLEQLSDEQGNEERKAILLELADVQQYTLSRPLLAAEYLARLFPLVNHEPIAETILDRLAQIYEEQSIWPKLIDTLEVMLNRAQNSTERFALLFRLAQVYELSLSLPDLAISVYQRTLAEDPHHPAVLDKLEYLYELEQQYDNLAELLRLKIDLAKGDSPRVVENLLRLARVQEVTNRLGDAWASLDQARALGPAHDSTIEDMLVRILLQQQKHHEAEKIIRDQISLARDESQPPENVAQLLLKLATFQRDHLHDLSSAQESINECLVLQPHLTEALQALSEILSLQEKWSEYIQAQTRLAAIAESPSAAAEILINAAKIDQEKLNNILDAKQLFEQALVLHPHSLPALDGLLGIVADDLDRREELLKSKLELVTDPRQEAEVLVELGRILQLRNAPAEAVKALYYRALHCARNLPSALDELSALLIQLNELEEAYNLLIPLVDDLERTPRLSILFLRLGLSCEGLNRYDEAYRYLLEAFRVDPNSLPIKIALGKNRFYYQRFREALRHLQDIADHPAAPSHTEQVVEALYIAGQCETSLRQEDQAKRYYETALQFNAKHLPSIRELARITTQNSEWYEAINYLQQEMALTEDARAQCILLRTIGNIYLQQLHDLQAAACAFEDLLGKLGDHPQVCLDNLPQLLPIFRQSKRHRAAAISAEKLAQLQHSALEMCNFSLQAADEWELAGESERAEASLRLALHHDPECIKAIQGLCQNLEAQNRFEELANLLSHFLSVQPSDLLIDPERRSQYAELYIALGLVQKQLGDEETAISTLEQALELQESILVREILAELYQSSPEHYQSALANHRLLLNEDGGRVQSLRILAHAFIAQTPYRAFCFYQILDALGELDSEGEAFLNSYKSSSLPIESQYQEKISEEDRRLQLSLPHFQEFYEILSLLWEALPQLLQKDLTAYQLTQNDQLYASAPDSTLARLCYGIAQTLGSHPVELYIQSNPGSESIRLGINYSVPAVIIPRLLAKNRSIDELRFLLARALELTQPPYILAAALERREFANLISSVLRAFHPRHMRGPSEIGEEAIGKAAALRRALPFKIARRLGEIFREHPTLSFDSGQWRQIVQLSANRVGLLLCGDLNVALRLLIEEDLSLATAPLEEIWRTSPPINDLIKFAASDALYHLRVKLGLTNYYGGHSK